MVTAPNQLGKQMVNMVISQEKTDFLHTTIIDVYDRKLEITI